MAHSAARRRRREERREEPIDFREIVNQIIAAADRSREGWTEEHMDKLAMLAEESRRRRTGEEPRRREPPMIRELRPSRRELRIVARRSEERREIRRPLVREAVKEAYRLSKLMDEEGVRINFRRQWVEG